LKNNYKKMKRLKKGIFPFIIGIHIILRLAFSDSLTNDEIITKTSNMMPNDHVTQNPIENNDISIKKGDLASLEVQ